MKSLTTASLRGILLLALLGATLAGCDTFEQRDRTYQGDPKLEFAPLSETIDEPVANPDTSTATSVQLIGEQRSSDLAVNFVVADSSTAESGVHYELSSTSVTIAANSSSAQVPITVLDNSADDGDTNYELFLVLQDSEGVEAAENLKTFTLTIRGVDE
jgi:carbon monoxide dehydrogenase subunit G